MKVCVIGAGIIGLSSTLKILDESPDAGVTLIAEQYPPEITSSNVAGFWEPFKIGDTPEDLCMKWSSSTFNHCLKLIREGEASKLGIELISGYRFTPEPMYDPPWKDFVFGYRQVTQREIDEFAPYAKGGEFFTSVMCNGEKYLPWLLEKIRERGCNVVRKNIRSLEELAEDFDVVVNCAGMGARRLVQDDSLVPSKGQLLTVKGVSQKMFWMDYCWSQNTAIFPRNDEIIIGGIQAPGEWSTTPSMAVQEDILTRAKRLLPSLKDGVVVKSWAGLRPFRQKGVRLELEIMTFGTKKLKVVHNYGHGGSGVTLHWGCAEEAARLVQTCRKDLPGSKL